MMKKRKLEVKSKPQAEPKQETEPTDGPIEEEAPEAAADDEILSEDEQKLQLSTETTTHTSLGSAPAPSDPTLPASDGDYTAVPADGEADDEPESIQQLLEPLSKDQLIELLREASERHADVMEQIQRIADADPVHRKIFVHGLGWDTNAETLASVFGPYGEIVDCNAVCDKISGKSKGYGFILFKHRSGARRALKEPQKKIGNRMTACQMASAGPIPLPTPPVAEYTLRKIYVSNVSAELDPQKLLQFFAKYGEIEEGPLGLDKQTGKPKGFALFVYRTSESAKRALEEPHKNFEGQILHCQKAIDGHKPNKPGFNLHHGGSLHRHGLHHGPGASGGAHGPHFARGETASFVGGKGSHVSQTGPGHMMAPSPAGLGFNQGNPPGAAAVAGINPTLGQALTALLTTPGAGLGLSNLLGSLGTTGMAGPVANQGMPASMVNSGAQGMQGSYGNQAGGVGGNMNPGMMGGYGGQAPMHGGYGNAPMGQGDGRGQQGVGHISGVSRYMGH